jgi:hypothetical protein
MPLGEVVRKWRGDINKAGQWGRSIMQRAVEQQFFNSIMRWVMQEFY